MMLKFLRVLLIVFTPFCASAGGFELNFQGIRQQGMANAGISTVMGSSGVFYNPAALVFNKDKFNFQAGFSALAYKGVFYEPISGVFARTKDQFLPIVSGYFSYKITDKLAVGFGLYSPYGGELQWEDEWRGRFLVQSIRFQTLTYQPTLAYKISKSVSFGIGLQYSKAGFNFSKDLPISSAGRSRNYIELSDNTDQTGVNAGVFVNINERWSAALAFQSEMNYDFDQGLVNVVVPQGANAFFTPNNHFSTNISTPNTYKAGVTFHPNRRFLVTADFNYQEWSTVRSTFIEFENQEGALQNSKIDRHFKDSPAFKIGAQYIYRSYLSLRAGAGFEKSPVDRNFLFPDLPDTDKYTFSAGMSYDFNDHWALDIAGTVIEGKQTNGNYSPYNFNGVYKSRIFAASVGLTLVF